jgi:hypothetical protein
LKQEQGAKMKRRKIARNKNKVAKLCIWKVAIDQNPNYESLRQEQGAKMKRRRTIRNKNKVAKLCTWEAAADPKS